MMLYVFHWNVGKIEFYYTTKTLRFFKDICGFAELKQSSQSPIMKYPRYDQPFRLYSDASSFSLVSVKVVVRQVQNGIEHIMIT